MTVMSIETDNDIYKNGNFIAYAILRSYGMSTKPFDASPLYGK